ncbi:hypothetical protein GPECTOR_74g699 [Gonium pectorale]|uniref:BART domain-containing protein n=1 Tax=Gonium pectorale TaxID=33097 RepID=A0A150G3K6_GONPE|nr:hypothetical protein GPECTOR_74g699 [Gonium pectorale]|eukprot:KXZ44085.1 hypothetical protein GPECTOR_74g699 [Gonium pectorale]
MQLLNFDIFKEYTQMVERQLEEFIRAEGLTVKDVCAACAAAQDSESHLHLASIDYLVASSEYESFMQLAYDHACIHAGYDESEEEGAEAEAAAAAVELKA